MYVYNIETKAPFVLPTFAEKFYLYGVPLWRRNVYNTDKQTCNLKSSRATDLSSRTVPLFSQKQKYNSYIYTQTTFEFACHSKSLKIVS